MNYFLPTCVFDLLLEEFYCCEKVLTLRHFLRGREQNGCRIEKGDRVVEIDGMPTSVDNIVRLLRGNNLHKTITNRMILSHVSQVLTKSAPR
jgi:hypothetical protein